MKKSTYVCTICGKNNQCVLKSYFDDENEFPPTPIKCPFDVYNFDWELEKIE